LARKSLVIASFGVPLGAAIVAGCSGGGSVMGTVPAKAPTTVPGKPVAQGPMIPVTILVNPPHRNAATRRRIAGSRSAQSFTPPPIIKIGVTIYAGDAPVAEQIFTVAPTGGPYPVAINVPIGSDTFVVNEYDNNCCSGPFAPNGYLLSTYTSATPIPVYQNAANNIAITTLPVAKSVTISATRISFFENQTASQTSTGLNFTLYDTLGNSIAGAVANPPVITSSVVGMLTGGVPITQSTAVPITYPAGTYADGTLTVTVAALPQLLPAPVTTAIPIYSDWFFLLGDSGHTVSAYDAVGNIHGLAGPIGTPAPVAGPPVKLVGAIPGCGTNLAQAMVGFSSQTGGYLNQILNIATSVSGLTVQSTGPVANQDTRGIVLPPGPACTGYVLSTNDTSSGTLYQINMGLGTTTSMPSPNPQASAFPQFLALDDTGTTLYTSDGSTGGIGSYAIASSTRAFNGSTFTMGSPVDLIAGNGHIYEATSAGYLYSFSTFTDPAPLSSPLGSLSSIFAKSPDGKEIFIAATSSISYYDNSLSAATSVSQATSILTGNVTAMVVSPNGQTLYAASSTGYLYSIPIGSLSTGFGPVTSVFSIPSTTTSIAISP